MLKWPEARLEEEIWGLRGFVGVSSASKMVARRSGSDSISKDPGVVSVVAELEHGVGMRVLELWRGGAIYCNGFVVLDLCRTRCIWVGKCPGVGPRGRDTIVLGTGHGWTLETELLI
ncbi:uncharacterized protein M6B38_143600 [Iris pallida]|uniref:Uncharacterized protein n=1 Tax=Iris pallida TaxID=29817 RepID=A0AAX6FAE6_IRIPA|nr:uncharacterized protein M6B38_143600 [Iris pallida]